MQTRSALHLLSYLAAMEANNNEMDRPRNIEVLLCKFNPLLEAMGNSRTSRNDNSSRFGKLIRLSRTHLSTIENETSDRKNRTIVNKGDYNSPIIRLEIRSVI